MGYVSAKLIIALSCIPVVRCPSKLLIPYDTVKYYVLTVIEPTKHFDKMGCVGISVYTVIHTLVT